MNVALLGHGTVGSGVAEILIQQEKTVASDAGQPIFLKSILDVRSFPELSYADRFVTDFSAIENDPEITVVIECIGGLHPAFDYVKRALLKGKAVVTSNKELVAEKGPELFALAEKSGVPFLYEAAVGGTIPIIRSLATSFGGAAITRVAGILNGTTNYILTAMKRDGVSYEAALAEAQRLGYAEADPTADVSGLDSGRKIAILASLIWKKAISPSNVPLTGLSSVTSEQIAMADSLGYTIKLIADARKTGSGLSVAVSPMLIPKACPLSFVDDVNNAVLVSSPTNGDVLFYGRGAGKLPTAAAVVADVISVVKTGAYDPSFSWRSEEKTNFSSEKKRFFVRITGAYPARILEWIETLVPSSGPDEHVFFTVPVFEHEFASLEAAILEHGGSLSKIPVFE